MNRLDKRSKEAFTKKLKNEKDESNFSAILTELGFFEHFASRGFSVELEKEYSDSERFNYKPDLTLTQNGQSMIAEVIRLNPTKKDDVRNRFENELMEKLETIQAGCWLQIDFTEEYFDATGYDINGILCEVRSWIVQGKSVGARLVVANNFNFEIVRIDPKLSHVCVLGNANSINIDTRRLNSAGSGFTKKISRYLKLISENQLPYLICLKIDFHAGIDQDEMFWMMYGDLEFHQHLNLYLSKMNGVYYVNSDARNYLSGVLLMVGNSIFYYHNYGQHKLFRSIENELISNQYFGKTPNKLIYLREKR